MASSKKISKFVKKYKNSCIIFRLSFGDTLFGYSQLNERLRDYQKCKNIIVTKHRILPFFQTFSRILKKLKSVEIGRKLTEMSSCP